MSKSITINLIEQLSKNFENLNNIKIEKNLIIFPENLKIDSSVEINWSFTNPSTKYNLGDMFVFL
jgi:hypothetical protein